MGRGVRRIEADQLVCGGGSSGGCCCCGRMMIVVMEVVMMVGCRLQQTTTGAGLRINWQVAVSGEELVVVLLWFK